MMNTKVQPAHQPKDLYIGNPVAVAPAAVIGTELLLLLFLGIRQNLLEVFGLLARCWRFVIGKAGLGVAVWC